MPIIAGFFTRDMMHINCCALFQRDDCLKRFSTHESWKRSKKRVCLLISTLNVFKIIRSNIKLKEYSSADTSLHIYLMTILAFVCIKSVSSYAVSRRTNWEPSLRHTSFAFLFLLSFFLSHSLSKRANWLLLLHEACLVSWLPSLYQVRNT